MCRLNFKIMVIHIRVGHSLERDDKSCDKVCACVCICFKNRDLNNCRCWKNC